MTKLTALGIALLVLAVFAASCDSPASTPAQGETARPAEGAADTDQPEKARLGEQVKDFTVMDSNGEALRRVEGEIAVLTFWCSMCGSCRMIERDFDGKATEYAARGVRYLAVASNYTDNPERVNRFLEDNKLRFRVLMDSESEIARYFDARFTTTTAVLDTQGRLRYYGGYAGAEAAVRNLLAGEAVADPESPGFGCAIMFKPQSGDDAPRGHDVSGFLDHLRERLRLTDEQAAKVDGVLDRLQRETQGLENPSPQEFMALRHQAIEDIRVTLDDEQRIELDNLVGGMGHGQGSGDHGQGHGGRDHERRGHDQ